MATTTHKVADLKTINYPRSGWTARIEWTCTCGKTGAVNDGRMAPTLSRARSAHRRHVAAATRQAVSA